MSDKDYTVEPHGKGWAIYRGRDDQHHGFNLGQLTESTPELAALIERALNAPGDAAPSDSGDNEAVMRGALEALSKPTPTIMHDDWRGKETAYRMDAYYYGFAPTGLHVVDLVLSAVACAGKAYHHTDQWNSDCSPYEHLRGETPADWINNAAHDAAAAIHAAIASLEAALGEKK